MTNFACDSSKRRPLDVKWDSDHASNSEFEKIVYYIRKKNKNTRKDDVLFNQKNSDWHQTRFGSTPANVQRELPCTTPSTLTIGITWKKQKTKTTQTKHPGVFLTKKLMFLVFSMFSNLKNLRTRRGKQTPRLKKHV